MTHRPTLEFLKTETASGLVLGLAALAAVVVANSPLSAAYFAWLKDVHALEIGPLRLAATVSDGIKEGLMSVFFLMVGLEIKYEILRGELSHPKRIATPILAALGGMAGPAAVYLALTGMVGAPHQGWPIPLATDIAFALAFLALVGRGLPPSLRVFLLTLAIVDDLGAVALIAILFSQGVDWLPLAWAAGLMMAAGLVAQKWRIPAPIWVLAFGAVWWLALTSGVSTSLPAVAFAAAVPVSPRSDGRQSPLQAAMHLLHPWNAYLILPLFAFAKAGVSFAGLSLQQVLSPLVVAIALGLFVGKQAGVLGAAWLASALRIGAKPTGATWAQVYGVAILCGIGFTMSLFIGALAFPGAIDSAEQVEVKLGVIAGSMLSALLAAVVLGLARDAKPR